ncbi:hypothetical protein TNCV_4147961 [Trichonephila clavipes]|nr:hypothetical protein TNCV_4147961 [Trichonephila clavipes]
MPIPLGYRGHPNFAEVWAPQIPGIPRSAGAAEWYVTPLLGGQIRSFYAASSLNHTSSNVERWRLSQQTKTRRFQ